MISITLEGQEAIRRALAALPREVQDKALRAGAQEAFNTAQDATDRHHRTGALKRSLRLRSIPNGWEVGHVTQEAPYAAYVHWGTRRHEIRPKTKKALRWAAGSGGGTGWVFAKSVMHPGYRGDPWMVRARDAAQRAILEAVRRL